MNMYSNCIRTQRLMDESLVEGVLGTLKFCDNEIDKNKAIEILKTFGGSSSKWYKETDCWRNEFSNK